MTHTSHLGIVFALLAVAACGDDQATGSSGTGTSATTSAGGSASATSTTSAGESTSTTATTSASDSASTTATTTAGGACMLPTDDPPGAASMSITITNDSNEARFLLPDLLYCTSRLVRLDAGDPPSTLTWGGDRDAGATPECSSGQLCGDVPGCSDGTYPGLVLSPGASHTVTWDGYHWASLPVPNTCADLPSVCAEPSYFSGDCAALRAIADATQITATVFLADTCPVADGDPTACACAQDSCPISVYDGDLPPNPQAVSVTGQYPQDLQIVLQ